MSKNDMINRYFEWMYDKMCEGKFGRVSFKKLFTHLHTIPFRYMLEKDRNRESDGIGLRYRFSLETEYRDQPDFVMKFLDGPCSVLEMMIALAFRCEEIMDDPAVGDRTRYWFWSMVVSLGLGSMYDGVFDEKYVSDKIDIFLNREYEPNGEGGLFTIRDCEGDLRDVEIWYQACWYLDTIA